MMKPPNSAVTQQRAWVFSAASSDLTWEVKLMLGRCG